MNIVKSAHRLEACQPLTNEERYREWLARRPVTLGNAYPWPWLRQPARRMRPAIRRPKLRLRRIRRKAAP